MEKTSLKQSMQVKHGAIVYYWWLVNIGHLSCFCGFWQLRVIHVIIKNVPYYKRVTIFIIVFTIVMQCDRAKVTKNTEMDFSE